MKYPLHTEHLQVVTTAHTAKLSCRGPDHAVALGAERVKQQFLKHAVFEIPRSCKCQVSLQPLLLCLPSLNGDASVWMWDLVGVRKRARCSGRLSCFAIGRRHTICTTG